ncbi:TIGR02117 family protein [Flavobacterium magnum]|uniref:TIGR02117 family protein n=2 Tax=Flavobacterium magnum TaxID=2162713 RepID=A0A2S0RGW7_9FLAO|nr:TIGR02117 family protein [Flavobacterium magnum]
MLSLLVFIAAYMLLAFLLSRISVNSRDEDPDSAVAIYLRTNGVHTDVVFPVENEVFNWKQFVRVGHTVANDAALAYVAFGWGDRDFYLHTPEWSDLKFRTAFNAAFYLGTSAMHVVFLDQPLEGERCRKIFVSRREYADMVAFVQKSFARDTAGNPRPILHSGYGLNDIFYEAEGRYSLFYTCNSWTNNTLKSGRQKAALWTLTDGGIFCHYQ